MIQWFNKQMSKKRKGFTLIELIVVIAILGILMAIAIPRFSGFQDSAAKRAVEADARSISSAFEVVKAETGSYPTDDTELAVAIEKPDGATIDYAPTDTDVLFNYQKVVNSKTWSVDVLKTGVVEAATDVTP